jgi:hypothetical protein
MKGSLVRRSDRWSLISLRSIPEEHNSDENSELNEREQASWRDVSKIDAKLLVGPSYLRVISFFSRRELACVELHVFA